MRQALAIICGVLFIALPSVAQSKSDQNTTPADQNKKTDKPATSKAQIVGTAEITKIDEKKKILQVRNVIESNNNSTSDSQQGPATNPRNRGGGYPGGGYPGGGYPGGGSRRRYPGGGYPGGGYPGGGGGGYPGSQAGSNQREYKVYVTKDTVLKLEDQEMEFKDMHVGDRIIIAGTPKGSGSDLEATTITRKF